MDKKDKEVYQKEMARLEKDLVILEDEYYEGNYVKRAVMSKEIEELIKEIVEDIEKEPYKMNEYSQFINKSIPQMRGIIDAYKKALDKLNSLWIEGKGLDIEEDLKIALKEIEKDIENNYIKVNAYKREDLRVKNDEVRELLKRRGVLNHG